jgi:hypothetical protein
MNERMVFQQTEAEELPENLPVREVYSDPLDSAIQVTGWASSERHSVSASDICGSKSQALF